ncbi:hypothetical protein K3495_g7997 [Podosphaera aphanis]|nr:hypothetical protein K3495_g13122 [Podosphaera aphanis]KAI1000201.1 hypothetical protein K3495_g7997 [Podosphaera aphanis]
MTRGPRAEGKPKGKPSGKNLSRKTSAIPPVLIFDEQPQSSKISRVGVKPTAPRKPNQHLTTCANSLL